jgi:hypothetical protein
MLLFNKRFDSNVDNHLSSDFHSIGINSSIRFIYSLITQYFYSADKRNENDFLSSIKPTDKKANTKFYSIETCRSTSCLNRNSSVVDLVILIVKSNDHCSNHHNKPFNKT